MGAGCLKAAEPKFFLREDFINGTQLEISKEEFVETETIVRAISALRQIHSLYSIAARSFVELEKHVNDFALGYWVGDFDISEHDTLFDVFFDECSLKVINLLNAHSAYLDQTPQRLKLVELLSPSIVDEFLRVCSEHYDANPDYRLFSCLRNFSQHNKLPVHGVSFGSKRELQDSTKRQDSLFRDQVTINPYFSSAELLNTKLKQKDRQLIEQLECSKIDIKGVVRSFVSSFGEVQAWLIEATEGLVKAAATDFESFYAKLSEVKGEEAKFVALVEDTRSETTVLHIRRNSVQRLVSERNRWGTMKRVFSGSVGGRLVKEKDTYSGSRAKVWLGS